MAGRYATPPGLSSRRAAKSCTIADGGRDVTAIRSLRSHRAGAGTATRSDLPRAAGADRAPRPRRLLRVSPGRAPYARDPQPGVLAERVPRQRRPAHDAHAVRAVRLRVAAAPSASPDRRDH